MRLELTAFRLWDWRAAYCATEALLLLQYSHLHSQNGSENKKMKKSLRWPGIEPGSTAWKAAMLTTIPPTLWWFLTFEGRATNKSSFWCTYPPLYLKIMETPWRNGSASDSRSEGCVFESRRGHNFISKMFVFWLTNTAINSTDWFYFQRLVSLDCIGKFSHKVRHQNHNYPK